MQALSQIPSCMKWVGPSQQPNSHPTTHSVGCQEKVGETGKRKFVGWTKHREIGYQFHRENNSLPYLSQDQLHSFSADSSLCNHHQLHSVPSARKPLEQCAGGRRLWLGCSVFSLLFLAVFFHWLPLAAVPFRVGWGLFYQQGRNVSAVAELIYVLEALLLNGLRGPDQRQPPCTPAELSLWLCLPTHGERAPSQLNFGI